MIIYLKWSGWWPIEQPLGPQSAQKAKVSGWFFAVSAYWGWTVFFLSGSPLILIKPPNSILGTSSLGSQHWPLKPPPTYFRLNECPQSRDAAELGHARHVNQFHHAISECWPNIGPLISQGQQNWPCGLSWTNFCQLTQPSFRVQLMYSIS